MNLYIDFGGTNFRYKLDNGELRSLESREISLTRFIDKMVSMYKIEKIAISFAGIVKDGHILSSPNIDIEPIGIKEYCLDRYNIELKIQNDLNCAALAEYNTLKTNSLAVFYIGTGFGSAFIDNGNLITGNNNQSGELGHIPFKKTPFTCGCGRDDCLELSVSGSGVKKWCEQYGIEKEYARLDKLYELNSDEAKIIIKNFYEGLAHAFHTTLNLFDYSTLVLGGSVGKNEKIKNFLEKEFEKSAFARKELDIRLSTLEDGSLEGTKYL